MVLLQLQLSSLISSGSLVHRLVCLRPSLRTNLISMPRFLPFWVMPFFGIFSAVLRLGSQFSLAVVLSLSY